MKLQRISTWSGVVGAVLGFSLGIAPVRAAAADPDGVVTAPAAMMGEVDLANCRALRGDKSVPATETEIVDVFNTPSILDREWLLPKELCDEGPLPAHYIVAFRKPIEVGTIQFSGSPTSLKLLKPGAAMPADPKNEAAWQAVEIPRHQSAGSIVTLPPGTVTQGLLFSENNPKWGSRVAGLRVMKARFQNITPMGIPFADSEYTAISSGAQPTRYFATCVTTGELPYWQNCGTDPKGIMHRPPVSDYSPSWFMLAWRQPQAISAVWLMDNFQELDIEQFVGPEGLSPRAGTEHDWKAIRGARPVRGYCRMIEFPEPVTTRGLRINITKTIDGPIAMLRGLHVLTDLKDRPVPPIVSSADNSPPPVRISYGYDFDGLATMVINDAQGHRVRNVFAREPLSKGPHEASWDLKDELGNTVPPGTYEWKTLAAPPLQLKYEMTCYPNVHENSPENPSWLTKQSGPGGWMADESSPRAVATSGEFVFLGSPVCESGVCFHTTDLTGKRLWAIPSFAAWAGSYLLAADEKTIFNVCFNLPMPDASKVETPTDRVWAIDIASHEFHEIAQLRTTSKRKRGAQWAAAYKNKLYLAVNAPTDWLATSASPSDVDLDTCYPRYAVKRKERYANEDIPDFRMDFMALFRTTTLPPRSTALEYIESMPGKSARHHVMMTFRKPIAVGSVILPRSVTENVHVNLSVLKPDAPFPPNPGDPKQWEPFVTQPKAAWDVATAPMNCTTRALRVSFVNGDEDPLNAIDDSSEYTHNPVSTKLELKTDKADDTGLDSVNWKGQLEGLKIIGRRFENIAPQATVRVSSGTVDKEGVWDAKRTKPLTEADPGIYAMQWATPQSLRGLAIKEIDGARTEIDVYSGTGTGPVDIASDKDWTHVRTYIQKRRTHWIGIHNADCRYIDGSIDFGKEIQTRAIRFRVVEQWSNFPEEEALHWDLKDALDPARCRIFGIAVMKYIGGETAELRDPLTYQRIEVFDGTSGKLTQEVPLPQAGPIAMNSSGELFGISGPDIVKVNFTGGPHQVIASNVLVDPQAMAIDKTGNFYVYDRAPDRRTIRVYDLAGKMIRNIGTPGGYRVGPWDPMRLNDIAGLAIDKNDQLWAADTTFPYPRRVALFSIDGTWKKDFLGNTNYGGGGVLDPFDKRRLFYRPMEFELDWETGHTRLKNLTWLGETPPGEVPIHIKDRVYLTTRTGNDYICDRLAIVYRYEKDHCVLAAAMGRADYFLPLTHNGLQAQLGIKSLRDHDFLWCDLNGDGEVQANEVTLLPRTKGEGDVFTLFNDDLGVQQGPRRYEVKEFLPTGVPVYEVKNFPNLKGLTLYRMNDGNFHTMGDHTPETLMTPDGKTIWTYPAEGWSVGGTVEQQPYTPEQVVGQFYMAGHATTHAGDLGEFFAFHTNMGSWNLWTADGMLAGTIFNDQRLPGVREWHMPEHERGLRLDDVTIGQEHFQAWICRTSDNHYYAVAGHNHISVVEILGLDKFKRNSGKITVTPTEIVQTTDWELKQAKKETYDRTRVVDCYRTTSPPTIDGFTGDWEAESAGAQLGEFSANDRIHGARLRSAWDDNNLYLCYEVIGLGPMLNSGEQWDRLFKTGAAVDLQIGLDPDASPTRGVPVAGDKRLLMTFTGATQKPAAVLYEAVVPGTPLEAQWKAVSPVAHVEFDRVRKLDDVKMAVQGTDNRYVVEVAIPLAELGLKPAENLRLKLDWGVLVTDTAGNSVLRRMYWSNQATGIVADVPSEAKLQPDLWGYVLFHNRGRRGFAEQPKELGIRAPASDSTNDRGTDKLLKDFERDLKDDSKGKK